MAFRQMRRARQALNEADTRAILKEGITAVLALAGEDGYPYALPVNYVFDGAAVYFHCARSGYKLECIARCDKASMCVVAQDTVLPEKFTTLYKSAIAFGRIAVVSDKEEMRRAAYLLAKKYCPDETDVRIADETDKFFPELCILKLSVEHLSGKQGSEFLQK